jgi:hypothetical protein
MAAPVNTGRVLLGGLLAGLVINVVSILNNMVFLAHRMWQMAQDHYILSKERIPPFVPIWVVLMFLVGIALVWLYAQARERMGPGPGTALKIGLLVGLVAGVPGNFAQASWSMSGRFLPFMWMLETIVGCTLGCIAGAWLYREKA